MKNRLRSRALSLACAGLLLGAGAALAQPKPSGQTNAPATAQPAQISRNGVLNLVRTTLIALHQANETGNYTVLRDLGSPAFQQANSAARLSEIFANLRAQNLDLSGVTVLEPQLTLLPQIEPNGMLRMAGFFPSAPMQVNFELIYAPVDGKWRPFGISVRLDSATPTAPAAEPAKPDAQNARPPAKPATTPRN